MQKRFLGILALLLLVGIFAIQNTQIVDLNFITWSTKFNLALIILITVLAGALLTYLFSLPEYFRKNKTIKTLTKKVETLEQDLKQIKVEKKEKTFSEKPDKADKAEQMGSPLV